MRHRDDFVHVGADGMFTSEWFNDTARVVSKLSVNLGELPVWDGVTSVHSVGNLSGMEASGFDVIAVTLQADVT